MNDSLGTHRSSSVVSQQLSQMLDDCGRGQSLGQNGRTNSGRRF